ncbi:hypothetical protein LSH36_246g05015 [Paralvinella palmiformis]|uniref:Uncharacterized protein n=1 Tax=Paralvinella palmiformis TaxID=53620 RepID=A0AAD9N4Z5_9ANNE|nr:hypothetical protein LSH36_246g05015 [Paralvinella palmiformis]
MGGGCTQSSDDPDDNIATARSDKMEQQDVAEDNSGSKTTTVSAPAPDKYQFCHNRNHKQVKSSSKK